MSRWQRSMRLGKCSSGTRGAVRGRARVFRARANGKLPLPRSFLGNVVLGEAGGDGGGWFVGLNGRLGLGQC